MAENTERRTPLLDKGAASKRNALGRGLRSLMSATAVAVPVAQEPARTEKTIDLPERAPAAPKGRAKGLAAVPQPAVQTIEPPVSTNGLAFLAISDIVQAKDQPRHHFAEDEIASLAASLKEQGVLQPLLVRPISEPGAPKRFELVAGERRWRAAQRAGLTQVPAIVKEFSDKEAFQVAIVENVQRANLNPIEEARAYQRLAEEFGATQSDIATTVGKDRTSVANSIRLLQLPDDILEMLIDGRLSAGHGRALLAAEADVRRDYAARAIEDGMSVRALERLVTSKDDDTATKPSPSTPTKTRESSQPEAVINTTELEGRLRNILGTKVVLKMSEHERGELKISFFSRAELENILDILGA